MTKAAKVYFYHSFPRQKDRALGLRILESILKKGLLLTAEYKTIRRCSDLCTKKFLQRRVCFTALTPDKVRSHARKFGSFSFEFDARALREFGALPALYLSGRLPNAGMLNQGGEEIARHLLLVHDALRRLWDMHDNGTPRQKRLAVAVLKKIKPEKKTVQELFFTAQTLLNLYYPTDDPKWTGPLGYYEQREWKITPNLVYRRKWHYDRLTEQECAELIALNPDFFGRKIRGKTRASLSFRFAKIGNANVVASARRLIVPDSLVAKCRRIVKSAGFRISVVGINSL